MSGSGVPSRCVEGVIMEEGSSAVNAEVSLESG